MSVVKNIEQKLTVLKIFQLVAIHPEAARLISNSAQLLEHFVPHIKESQEPDVQLLSFQVVNKFERHLLNICILITHLQLA